MTLKTRVIPVVLWHNGDCVQTVKFQRPFRRFGALMDTIQVYERRNVDELILLDIGAGHRVAPMFNEVLRYARELFCPVTIGGGIRTLGHIEHTLRNGADKVSIRTAATPQFIEDAARRFGSQAIVFSLDATWVAPHDGGMIDRCMVSAQDAEAAGAGEILLTSVERNGTMQGYDLPLISAVAGCVDIPVIAHGGCGTPHHMFDAVQNGAHAVAASTMFLFTETTPRDCSRYLENNGIAARIT